MDAGKCKKCKKRFKKQYKSQKFCSLTCANSYNLNGLKKVKLPRRSIKLAEFIGIVMGDGNVSKYFSAVTLNSIADAKYIPYVANLMRQLFPKAPISVMPRQGGENATRVQISSRIVADFLRFMGMVPYHKIIPDWILAKKSYRLACIRGLFDTEGSISFKTYRSQKGVRVYKQLNFRNADVQLMRFVRDNLITLGLKPTTTLRRSLYLSNTEAINTYRKKIGFSNPKLLQRSQVNDYAAYVALERWQSGRSLRS